MNIGILYICTGKYNVFWKDFFDSCEKYFLPKDNKEYFVFTDADYIKGEKNTNVHKIYQENLGWPDNTLMRFNMFHSIKEKLVSMDYLFFFNANLMFIKVIERDFLPQNENLSVVIHPGFRHSKPEDYPYERKRESLAYIPYGSGKIYVQGALNGGKTKDYLDMIEELDEAILKDKEKGIVAIWHDESHLNHYIIGRTDLKILGPEYVNQEDVDYGVEPMIISRNKDNYMNIDDLRGIKKSNYEKLVAKLKKGIKYILRRK